MKTYVETECRNNTVTAYSNIIQKHINPYLGKYRLASLSPSILQEHINYLYANNLSATYLTNIIAVISGALSYAVHPAGFLKESPANYIHKPRIQTKKADINRRVISKQEFSQILDYFSEGNQYRILFLICYYTGFRISECTGLTWDRIDLDNGTITIDRILVKHRDKQWHFGLPKTATSERTISIGQTLIKELYKQKKWQLKNRLRYGEYYKDYYVTSSRRIYGLDSTVAYSTVDEPISFVCTQENGTLINPDLSKYASRIVNYKLNICFNFHSLRHPYVNPTTKIYFDKRRNPKLPTDLIV